MSGITITTPPTATSWVGRLEAVTGSLCHVLLCGQAPPPVMVSISEDRVTVTPWLPGAPISALLAWSNYLDDCTWSAVVHEPIPPGTRPLCSLYCVGTLNGFPVELIGSVFYRELPGVDQDVRGTHQPVDAKTVIVEAAREEPIDLSPEPKP